MEGGSAWRSWLFHKSMAPGEAGTHHGCGDLSGVNGTPLLREAEFTHGPSLQAGERMLDPGGKARWKAAKVKLCL